MVSSTTSVRLTQNGQTHTAARSECNIRGYGEKGCTHRRLRTVAQTIICEVNETALISQRSPARAAFPQIAGERCITPTVSITIRPRKANLIWLRRGPSKHVVIESGAHALRLQTIRTSLGHGFVQPYYLILQSARVARAICCWSRSSQPCLIAAKQWGLGQVRRRQLMVEGEGGMLRWWVRR